MAPYAALNHTTWVGGYDLTGDTNSTSLDIVYDELDTSVHGGVGRTRIAGLESVESTVQGPWQSAASGALDPEAFAGLGSTTKVVTQTATGASLDVAWLWQARKFQYQIGGQIGELFPYEMTMRSAAGAGTTGVGAVRGRLLQPKGAVSATGAMGSGYQLGAVGAGQYLYAAAHLFTAGTTVTFVLESDDNALFSSATTRATLGPLTAVGGTWATRVAGPITDDYYRFRVTAITGTFTIGASAGIK